MNTSRAAIVAMILAEGGDPNQLHAVGIRGASGANKIGVYDDKIILTSPNIHEEFKGNTDPSRVRKGRGTGAAKGMAHLKPGYYRAHKFGLHRGKYTALIQAVYSPGGEVTVIRDGDPPYADKGWFGINIHKGGYGTTSSLGCQTIHPDQWSRFITMAQAEARRLNQSIVPYLLHDAIGDVPTNLPVRHTGTLNIGVEGERVGELQTELNAWLASLSPSDRALHDGWLIANTGRHLETLNVDSDFGEATERLVKAYQHAKGLNHDGKVGPLTLGALGL